LDRFLLQLSLGYPVREESVEILKRFVADEPLAEVKPVCTGELLLEIQRAVKEVYVHEDVYGYMVDLAQGTRNHEAVVLGISTRGVLALARMAQAYCAINGQDFVTPKDVLYLMPYVFSHRIMLKGGLRNRHAAVMSVLEEVVGSATAPVEEWKSKEPKVKKGQVLEPL